MTQRAILTVDLGTTFFKVSLFDDGGELCASARVAPPIVHRSSVLWELAPEAFVKTLKLAVAETLAAAPQLRSKVAAISFATQANSFTILDRAGKPLAPFILWPDERAAGGTGVGDLLSGLTAFRRQTGVPELGPTFAVAKLHHMLNGDAELRRVAHSVRFLPDYWLEWLTGNAATEAGVAGLTAVCDISDLHWMPQALELAGLGELRLPPVVRAGSDLGPLRTAAAEALGLPVECRVVMGALDQYTGAIGVGNVAPGMVSETTGTVLAVVGCATALEREPQPYFQGPGWSGERFYRMSFGSVSANILEWYQQGLADKPGYAELDIEAAAAAAGAGGISLRDAAMSGAVSEGFNGPAASRNRGNEVRCILERVAHALAEHVAVVSGIIPPAEIRCAGGGARSDVWLQIKADITGIPMCALKCPEPTSLGAAMLAGAALEWGSMAELAAAWVKPRRIFEPCSG